MATESVIDDIEKLIEQSDADSESFDNILSSLKLSEEECIALRYLNLRHASYVSLGLGLGYDVAYCSFSELLGDIEKEDINASRRRYEMALSIPGMEPEYKIRLRLVEDANFRETIFNIYQSRVWPIMQQSVA